MPDPYRAWTAEDARRALALDAAGVPGARVAEILGRTRAAVYHALSARRGPRFRPARLAEHEAALRRLHAEGCHDAEAARRLGLCDWTVAKWRRRLGLPPNLASARAASGGALTPRSRRKGVESRRARWRALGLCAGWPGLSPWDARVMTAVWLRGEAGPAEAAPRLGVGHRQAYCLLRRLCARGLLLRGGAGNRAGAYRYRVAPGLAPCATALPRLLAEKEGRLEEEDAP